MGPGYKRGTERGGWDTSKELAGIRVEDPGIGNGLHKVLDACLSTMELIVFAPLFLTPSPIDVFGVLD